MLLGPGMRADLILDMVGAPGDLFATTDSFFPRGTYGLTELAYSDAAPLRAALLAAPTMLPPNPLADPVLDAEALRVEIAFGGGAMGGLQQATLDGERLSFRGLLRSGDGLGRERGGNGGPRPRAAIDPRARAKLRGNVAERDRLVASDPLARPYPPRTVPQWRHARRWRSPSLAIIPAIGC